MHGIQQGAAALFGRHASALERVIPPAKRGLQRSIEQVRHGATPDTALAGLRLATGPLGTEGELCHTTPPGGTRRPLAACHPYWVARAMAIPGGGSVGG